MNYTVNLEQIDDYNTHKLVVNPKRAALLVIEMQNVFRTDLNIITISNVAFHKITKTR